MNKKRIFISVLLIFLLSLLVMPFQEANASLVQHQAQESVPSGYVGIYSVEDLKKINNGLEKKYILMDDLDFSDSKARWNPIGTDSAPFSGELNGNGHSINNLNINVQSESPIYAGLFGYVKDAKIFDLNMNNVSIHAKNSSIDSNSAASYAGGLAGYLANSELENISVSGHVEAESLFNGYAGGIAGSATADWRKKVLLSNMKNSATIKAKTSAGGIAGQATRTQIQKSENHGIIDGGEEGGGIFGEGRESTAEDLKNLSDVSGGKDVGGIMGDLYKSEVLKAFNSGRVTSPGKSSTVGGIAGSVKLTKIINSTNMNDVSAESEHTSAGGIVGYLLNNSSLVMVSNKGNVRSGSYAAGIASANSTSLIKESYNSGNVDAVFSAGGIISSGTNSTIIDSFNTGRVIGGSIGGGIVGLHHSGTLNNSYNIGNVSIESSRSASIGGVAGDFTGTMANVYYLNKMNAVGIGSEEGSKGISFENMPQKSSYENYDFDKTWKTSNEDYLFPQLTNVPFDSKEQTIKIEFKTPIVKTEYIRGEKFVVGGATLNAYTSYGKMKEVKVTEEMVRGYDPDFSGWTQNIVIEYDGHKIQMSVKTIRGYDVLFLDQNGNVIEKQKVGEGKAASPPNPPDLEGHTFTGWSGSTENVRSNLTVYAQYEPVYYSISYMDGSNRLKEEAYQYGSEFWPSYIPEKSGYTFAGWFYDSSLTKKFSQSIVLKADIVLNGKFLKKPSAPSGVKVTSPKYDELSVSWSPLKGAQQYEVVMATRKEGPYDHSAQINGKETRYTFTALETGRKYYFKVKSLYEEDGITAMSSDSAIVSGTPTLKAVSSMKMKIVNYQGLKLSWGMLEGAEGYEIYQSGTSTGKYRLVTNITEGAKTSFTHNKLKTGQTYYYKVRAYRLVNGKKVYGAYSKVISGKPELAKVSGVKITSLSYDQLKINWSKVDGASGYVIYQATSKNGTYDKKATISNGGTVNYTVKKLVTGKNYYYKVRAFRTVDGKRVYGSYSNITQGQPLPNAPKNVKASKVSSTSSKLTWSTSSGASGYVIYRSSSKNGTYSNIATLKNGNSKSYTNEGLSKKKTYYYKVRSYRVVSGKRVYSNYSATVTYKN